jgi:hypothetical protein
MTLVGRLPQIVVAALVMAVASACSARTLDYEEDFIEEVEQICVNYCEKNLACHEPAWFETYEDCEAICLNTPFAYNDTICGQARRDMMTCIGSTTTCELYNDTNNVHADQYTCQFEKEFYLDLNCGQTDEEPFPQGAP